MKCHVNLTSNGSGIGMNQMKFGFRYGMGCAGRVETQIQQSQTNDHPLVLSSIQTARQVEKQDVEVDSFGEVKLRQGVAQERRISVEDEEMRHGRKSRSQRFDGYKRHVLRDLDTGLVRAVGVTRANIPEASVTDAIATDLKLQKINLVELHIDRAY